jgi:hypothetical protein
VCGEGEVDGGGADDPEVDAFVLRARGEERCLGVERKGGDGGGVSKEGLRVNWGGLVWD